MTAWEKETDAGSHKTATATVNDGRMSVTESEDGHPWGRKDGQGGLVCLHLPAPAMVQKHGEGKADADGPSPLHPRLGAHPLTDHEVESESVVVLLPARHA